MPRELDIEVTKGSTFSMIVLAEVPPIVYKTITGITNTAPVRITATAHGLHDGWKVAVTNVKGMTELNAEANNVTDADRHHCTVVDVNTIEFNDVNAVGFKQYVASGVLQYYTPVDLTGFVARMSISDRLGGTELFRLDSTIGSIALSPSACTITLTISATESAAFTFSSGVYDLEIESPAGVVTKLLKGAVTVLKEATTT